MRALCIRMPSADDEAALDAFQRFFAAFLSGSLDELLGAIALPYFDLRDGELTELRSAAQLDGFRRGLRARMASLGITSGTLGSVRVINADASLALIEFESIRLATDGAADGGTLSLACLRCDGARWGVWMITVLRTHSAWQGRADKARRL